MDSSVSAKDEIWFLRGEKQIIEMKNGKKLILRAKKAREISEEKV
jgi:hypothetical protein